MCAPYPQRLDTAGYQMIIKDDDPESPVRTKTSLLTRETHPSGSRVVILGGPRCRPPMLLCAKLDATTAFLTIEFCPMSSCLCAVWRLGSQMHTHMDHTQPTLLLISR